MVELVFMSLVSGMDCRGGCADFAEGLARSPTSSTLNDSSSRWGCMQCYSTFLASLAGTALLTDYLPWYLVLTRSTWCFPVHAVSRSARAVRLRRYRDEILVAFHHSLLSSARTFKLTCDVRVVVASSPVPLTASCRYKVEYISYP